MFKKLHILPIALIAALFAVSLTGCPAADTGKNSIVLCNLSDVVAVAVYLTPSGSPSWGFNQLLFPLVPGGVVEFYNIEDGTYDLLVVGSGGGDWLRTGIHLYGGVSRTFDLFSIFKTGENGGMTGVVPDENRTEYRPEPAE